ncbi:MAG: hypothetical protein IJ848_00575 [Alphaproteobacteria bacterium]|nr:hypothetical protein [Alphaproteobacteria bacterium]
MLDIITIACLTLLNSINSAVDVTINQNVCNLKCNNENKTFDINKESLDEVNNCISNYFHIDAISYEDKSNTMNFRLSHVKNSVPCVFIIKNINKHLLPNLNIKGEDNTFNNLILLGFKDIKLTSLTTQEIYFNKITNHLIGRYNKSIKVENDGLFIIRNSSL